MSHKKWIRNLIIVCIVLIPSITACLLQSNHNTNKNIDQSPSLRSSSFDGLRAYRDVKYQLSLPPRTPDSESHKTVRNWILTQLEQSGWDTQIQTDTFNGTTIYNLIGNHDNRSPYILIGAHYDSRFTADQDPDPAARAQGVPGANDGASGVAVLLELARSLPLDARQNIWLVFFDAEDQGRIKGWEWIIGSQSFADNVKIQPEKVIIIDMVGDKNLQIFFESNSDSAFREEIWDLADSLGYKDFFINQIKHSILDDHIPFVNKGIPSVDIIDFDYPYWHTTQDTLDKISSESLSIVGHTLWMWVVNQ